MKRGSRIQTDPEETARRAERRAARRASEPPRPEDLARQERQEAAERAHPDPSWARIERKPTVKPRRRPISAASREQVAKRNAGASIVSGETRGLDAAHICPRALGGCDHPDCTVPLTRREHRAFDNPDPRTGKRLDILPYLVAHGCHAELAHALEHYRCDLPALLERVTGEPWQPVAIHHPATHSSREDQ